MPIITKDITYFGQPCTITCDAQCQKAWGFNQRPKVQCSDDPDDYAFKADGELGNAPVAPGTYEGGHGKPTVPEDRLNKWCCRQCERCTLTDRGEPVRVKNFLQRVYNIPHLHPEAANV